MRKLRSAHQIKSSLVRQLENHYPNNEVQRDAVFSLLALVTVLVLRNKKKSYAVLFQVNSVLIYNLISRKAREF